MRAPDAKPRLSMLRIVQMNLGFLGLQFSFGLQQGNMAPIYSYLGASEGSLPLLQLAGPMTGLIIQPLIGAWSDRTDSRWGRRTPYFLAGAVLCAIGLFFMPLSASIAMAVSLLWILDAGNNITMEPYRAYVSDRLNEDQHETGFLTQAAFTGLAQMLAFLTPSLLVALGMNQDAVDAHHIPYTAHVVFTVGAVLSLVTIVYSVRTVPELPLSLLERARIAKEPKGLAAALAEIGSAIRDMPTAMRKLTLMSLFQWYAMAAYWGYVIRAGLGSAVDGHHSSCRRALRHMQHRRVAPRGRRGCQAMGAAGVGRDCRSVGCDPAATARRLVAPYRRRKIGALALPRTTAQRRAGYAQLQSVAPGAVRDARHLVFMGSA